MQRLRFAAHLTTEKYIHTNRSMKNDGQIKHRSLNIHVAWYMLFCIDAQLLVSDQPVVQPDIQLNYTPGPNLCRSRIVVRKQT